MKPGPVGLELAPKRIREFWHDFDVDGSRAHRFYEPFKIGLVETDADHGARLILEGIKTATSSLLWEYELSGRALPQVGSLSVLLDGRDWPICVVETTEVWTRPYAEIEGAFCVAYAEGDGSVEGWRAVTWPVYQVQCQALGCAPSMDMPLVCERFRVVHPAGADDRRRAIDAIDTATG